MSSARLKDDLVSANSIPALEYNDRVRAKSIPVREYNERVPARSIPSPAYSESSIARIGSLRADNRSCFACNRASRAADSPATTGQLAGGQRKAGPGLDWPALPELRRAQPRMSGRDALKIAQPFMAGSASNPTNQVPAGTKESPVFAKDSAVPERDFGRFRNVNPAINGWAIFKLISIPPGRGNGGRLHGG